MRAARSLGARARVARAPLVVALAALAALAADRASALFGGALVGVARASELTELNGPWLEAGPGPIAFRASLDYRWRQRELAIRRELDCLAHEAVGGASLCPDGSRLVYARDLVASRVSSELDVDLRMAFYAALEVRLRLPFVLSEASRLGFDAGVDARSSRTAPYNAPALFEVPFDNGRAGLGDPVVGVWATVLSPVRAAHDPTLAIGLEVAFPLAPVRTPGGDGVGAGAWELTLSVAGSDRVLGWLEPFFRFDAAFAIAASEALYPDLGNKQATPGPSDEARVRFGVELIPYERRDAGRAVRIELGGELAFVSRGKSASELFDALGTSPCSPDAEPPCVLTTHAVGARATGMTIVEEHARGGLWLGASYDVMRALRVSARANVGWETAHFLTSSNLGADLDGRGVETSNSFGVNEHDPDYNPSIDAPGERFRADEVVTFGVEVGVTARF